MGNADSKPCCMFGGDGGQGIEVIEADTVLSVERSEDSDVQDKTVILSAGTVTGPHTLSWGAEGLPMVAPVAADSLRKQSQLTPMFHLGPEIAHALEAGTVSFTSAPTRPDDASQEPEGMCAIPSEGMPEPSPDPGQQSGGGIVVAPPAAVAQPGKDVQSPFVQLPARVSPHLLYPWRNSLQPPHSSRRPVGPFVGEPFSSLLTYMRVVRVAERDAQVYTERDPDIWFEAEDEKNRGDDDDDDDDVSSLQSPFSGLVTACMEGYGAGKFADSNTALEQTTPATSSTQASTREDFSNGSFMEAERFAKLLVLFELELLSMFAISLLVTLQLTPVMEGGSGFLVVAALALAASAAWVALWVNRKAHYLVNTFMLVVFAATTGAAAGLTQLVVPGALGCQFLAVIALATILFGLQQASGLIGCLAASIRSMDPPSRQAGPDLGGAPAMTSVLPSTAGDLKALERKEAAATLAWCRAAVALVLALLNWFVALISCSMLCYALIEVPPGVSIAVALLSLPTSLALHICMENHLHSTCARGVCEAVIGLNTSVAPPAPGRAHAVRHCPKEDLRAAGSKAIPAPTGKLNADLGAGIDDGSGRVEDERDSSTDLAVGPQEGSESCAAPASTCEEDSYTYTSDPMFL
mmetsp:Transcript_17161/g.39946  ORF Transcript_17161/g.39946 Transcript_17161/m.39946 type:complete len:638 (+) Transcript_17161:81-1994(+)